MLKLFIATSFLLLAAYLLGKAIILGLCPYLFGWCEWYYHPFYLNPIIIFLQPLWLTVVLLLFLEHHQFWKRFITYWKFLLFFAASLLVLIVIYAPTFSRGIVDPTKVDLAHWLNYAFITASILLIPFSWWRMRA